MSALLDKESGVFAENVALKQGLEQACRRLRQKHVVTGARCRNQEAVSMNFTAIPEHWCMRQASAPAEFMHQSEAQTCTAPGDNDVCDCNELIRFLRDKGLRAIAAKFSEEMGMELVEDLMLLKQEDLDDPDFKFLRRWHKKRLLELARDCTAHALSLTALNDSDLSEADTASRGADTDSESGDDSYFEMVACKHEGDHEDFQRHMRAFIREFLGYLWITESSIDEGTETFLGVPSGLPDGRWTFCMMVWVRFANDASFDGSSRSKWLAACRNLPTQELLLGVLDSLLKVRGTDHHTWARFEFELMDCSKKYAAAIFVTDKMARHHLRGHDDVVRVWQQDVVRDWFQNNENASAFLLRANRFLRQHVVDGISVVNHVVKTQSYVAFMRMPSLASLLLFEYLEVRKSEHLSQAAACSSPAPLHGFRMFVSSTRRIFSLTDADMRARRAMPTVIRGLQCLS